MLDPATHRPALWPRDQAPVLTVIVDTEEEFDWTRPLARENTSVSAMAEQERAHDAVFDAYGVRPCYVADWPVVTQEQGAAPLRALLEAGRCTVGAHLHPWVTPPQEEEVCPPLSYPGNLPPELERAKLNRLTTAITEAFGQRPRVYKAGRYGVGPNTARLLAELGYEIDASIVPGVAFTGDGGPDFRALGREPTWTGPGGGLLELPVTCGFLGALRGQGPDLFSRVTTPQALRWHVPGVLSRSGLLERVRLSPEGASGRDMVRLLRRLLKDGSRVVSLTYHSPSLKPGCTPYVRDDGDLQEFLAAIAHVLRFWRDEAGGTFATPGEIHARILSAEGRDAVSTAE